MVVRELERSLVQWELGVKEVQRRRILPPTPRERERRHAIVLLAQGWMAAATAGFLDQVPTPQDGSSVGVDETIIQGERR